MFDANLEAPAHASSTITVFPKHGVTISYLNQFIEQYGPDHDGFQGYTTTDICNLVVKPLTIIHESSFCDLLLLQDRSDIVKEAHIFIFRAWQCLFLDVVDAFQYHFLTGSISSAITNISS